MVFCNLDIINDKREPNKVTILILIDGFLQSDLLADKVLTNESQSLF